VFPVEKGIWHEKAALALTNNFRDRSDWSFALHESTEPSGVKVPVDTISAIVEDAGWQAVDVLKIDIEGSEFPLFRNLHKWRSVFESVKIISIEVHEELGPVKELSVLLNSEGFTTEIYQELLIGIRRS
jgi:FkbM family methyltransferase